MLEARNYDYVQVLTLQCKTLGYIYIISWKLAEKQ